MGRKFRRGLERVASGPPRVLLARAVARASRALQRRWRQGRDRWPGTGISDRQLRSALRSELRDEHSLLDFRRSGRAPGFVPPGGLDSIASGLHRHCPGAAALTISAADQACAHVFDLLGSGPVSLGGTIDWHMDFKSGHRYDAREHSTRVSPASTPGGHDIKVPWELSRCQHLPWLGQAYRITGDERYPREFVAQVTAWIESNHPAFGVNWVCTMDVAIRVVNWLWAYHCLAASPALTDDFLLQFEKSLLAHGRHILGNLERAGRVTHNHYLSDLVGLVALGMLCPEFREAARWRELGLRELWREMEKQVHADGVDFEASVSYHRLVVELFLLPVLLCQLQKIAVPAAVMARLEKMIEFVLHYTRPDGGAPLFGDCDNGRLHRLKAWGGQEREWADHRHLLAIGAVLFQRDDFGRAAGDQWEEAFWLLGERAIRFTEALGARGGPVTEPDSRRFPDGGLCFLRGGGSYVAVDAGGVGQGGMGGHAHNDTLGFEFAAGGQPWVLDPGSGVYTADFATRNRFRSSHAHPVLVIDGEEINRFDERELFAMRDDARPVVELWDRLDERDLLVARHRGYERLKPSVSVRRAFWLDRRTGILLVMDEARTTGRHAFVCGLPLVVASIEIAGRIARIERMGADGCLAVCVVSGGCEASLTAATGWVSPGYGIRRPAPVLEIAGQFEDRMLLSILLVPQRGSAPAPAQELLAVAERMTERCRREAGAWDAGS